MGKVVKGARASDQRYTLTVPQIAPAPRIVAPPAPAFDECAFDAYGSERTAAFDMPPADAATEPAVDVEALRRDAERLIADAAAAAETLVNDAHERARALVEDASHRANAIAEDARRTGHDAGFAAGTHAADREMSGMLASMGELVEAARLERRKIILSAEPELVRLAVGIAERVIHQQVALDRSVVVEMARTAVTRLVDRESVTVRVNPADIERMREHRDEMLAYGDIKNLRIIEDQRVDRGGVIVETEAGTIDAKISTQLAEAKKVLHIDDDVVLTPADEHPRVLHAARAS